MRFQFALAFLWLFGSSLVLWLGSSFLFEQEERGIAERFQRDTRLLQQALTEFEWPTPWEVAPEWERLETEFDVDMIPLILPKPPGTGSMVVVSPAANSPATESSAAAIMPHWHPTIRGMAQLQTTAELTLRSIPRNAGERQVAEKSLFAAEGAEQKVHVLFARKVLRSSQQRLWWISGGAIFALGTLLATALVANYISRNKREYAAFSPWNRVAQSPPPHDQPLQLPHLPATTPLCLSLDAVADAVNANTNQLHNANQRSNLALGNLQEGVLAVDDQSRVLLANQAVHEHLELANEPYLYRPFLEVVRVPLLTEIVQHVLSRGTPREETGEIGTRARALRILGRPLPLGNGCNGVLITIRDETLLKRIDAVRKDFIANASHELKTPLAAIRAYAETLQMGALDDREAAEKFVASIISQADRIDGLVKGMLQLTRVESNSALKMEAFDAAEALEPCLTAARAMSLSKSIQLELQLPEHPLIIQSDRDGFQTIASNLLSNAVRYTPEGGKVQISLTETPQHCVLSVIDNGIGIREADLERIFERFYRAEKGRSSDTGGTGLGLSIVKHLINALGGSVTATSQLQSGSCFEVRLPLPTRRQTS
ncbi:sensor histidine kinase [Aureliella helgolandensis]|uniref:histidine kinase n=1 Tax=Aureliella helgolandensis TaxID=2527968 RepID=A0A518GFK7_9BACT|nr:ATP-binding protein [Aureliella helgolandensis]QDV27382.1 Alkaline phosphatase synthesis sensor protein PhoR [Aureliella helgolandensis]